jgi:hypothetical protein
LYSADLIFGKEKSKKPHIYIYTCGIPPNSSKSSIAAMDMQRVIMHLNNNNNNKLIRELHIIATVTNYRLLALQQSMMRMIHPCNIVKQHTAIMFTVKKNAIEI